MSQMFPLRKLTSLLPSLPPSFQGCPPHHCSPFISLKRTAQKTLMHTAHTLSPAKWMQRPRVRLPYTIAQRETPSCVFCLSFCAPWMRAYTTQRTQGCICQVFYNIVCLTTHKHTARRLAQSKQAARSDTQRPLALLKRATLGPPPGSHTAPLGASTLPGVRQRLRRHAQSARRAVGPRYELKWQL